ncbi:MinD/ParA family ATP-binding protein [Natronomonas sp. EA1]|uniref:MinD/ParA family ATP-binding protein n=1 Tax=Natronomonas sp. EA1 TaxID=3421655 RepID=UPI003EB75118
MLAIAGGKGGVGKTTTALALARARNALVVDCDRDCPDLGRLAGVGEQPGVGALARGRSLAACAGESDGALVVPLEPNTPSDTIEAALRGLPSGSIVDCPAGAGRDAALPLRVADRALLVTTATPQALADTAKTAAMARALDCPPVAVAVTGPRQAPDAGTLLGCDRVCHLPTPDAAPRIARLLPRFV